MTADEDPVCTRCGKPQSKHSVWITGSGEVLVCNTPEHRDKPFRPRAKLALRGTTPTPTANLYDGPGLEEEEALLRWFSSSAPPPNERGDQPMGFGCKSPLKDHPNFSPPRSPHELTVAAVVRFTLDYAANLVSPPKVDGEDEERSCNDVAEELRGSVHDVLEALRRPNMP